MTCSSTDPIALFQAAVESRSRDQLTEAAHKYACAIRVWPTFGEAHLNSAFLLSELDRPEEAINSYSVALRQREWPAQTAVAAYGNLGLLLKAGGRQREADAAFRAAQRAQPGSAVGGAAEFAEWIRVGNDHYAAGSSEEAAAAYRRALPLRDARTDGSAYVGLGAAEPHLVYAVFEMDPKVF